MAASPPPTGLQSDLSVRLHGQHLAGELVLTTVRDYLALPRPDKALALSFHGWSGTGKNFVAQMLAENLYRDGLRSDCVKVFVTMLHFPHPRLVDLYKVRPCSAGAGPGRGSPPCGVGGGPSGRTCNPETSTPHRGGRGHVEERRVPNTTCPRAPAAAACTRQARR